MATRLLTLAQAAELLGRSPDTLRRQVQRGALKAQLVGKTYVVTPSEVERYRAEHLGVHRGGFPAGRPRPAARVYRVTAERDGDAWLLRVDGIERATEVRALADADAFVRDLVHVHTGVDAASVRWAWKGGHAPEA